MESFEQFAKRLDELNAYEIRRGPKDEVLHRIYSYMAENGISIEDLVAFEEKFDKRSFLP